MNHRQSGEHELMILKKEQKFETNSLEFYDGNILLKADEIEIISESKIRNLAAIFIRF